MASGKAFVYGNNQPYFHISLQIICAVVENNVANTVNGGLRGGAYMTSIRCNEVLK